MHGAEPVSAPNSVWGDHATNRLPLQGDFVSFTGNFTLRVLHVDVLTVLRERGLSSLDFARDDTALRGEGVWRRRKARSMAAKRDVERIPVGAKLELYIKPTCPYCRDAMAHYDATGTPYVVHDAQNDLAQRKRMFAYTHNDPTVPAIVIDGVYVQSGWGSPPRG